MKEKADRDLSIGGAGLGAEAIRAGLVDLYLLRLVPTIVGGGTSALPDAARVDLALNTTQLSTTTAFCSTTASAEPDGPR